MKSTPKSVTIAAMISGLIGFGMLLGFSMLFWWLYPYPDNATEEEIKLVWAVHTLSEKLFGYLVLAICAVSAAIPLRNPWRYGFAAAIGSGIVFQVIAILYYVTRFGFTAYLEYNRFWSTMGMTITISALFGFIAVWRSYRREHKQLRDNKRLESDAGSPRL
jgi:hypothetical protein